MTYKEKILNVASFTLDDLKFTSEQLEAIADTAVLKVTLDVPIITRVVVLENIPPILDFTVVPQGRVIRNLNTSPDDTLYVDTENMLYNKEPANVLNIMDEDFNSVFHRFRKIGHLIFENKERDEDCLYFALLQYQVGLDDIDIITQSKFEIIFNLIIYAIRYLVYDFLNSEKAIERVSLYKKNYNIEKRKIIDEILYFDDLHKNERIKYYER